MRSVPGATGSGSTLGRSECQNRERSDRIRTYAWQIGVSEPRAQRPDQDVRLADRSVRAASAATGSGSTLGRSECQNRERSDRIRK